MSANIKASVDGTQAIIGVGGVDQMTVSNAGVVTANSFVGLNSSSVTATGSTAARTLANRFADVVNVKDFGAVGDGVVDDTVAIQNAFNTASNIEITNGIYVYSYLEINNPIKIQGNGVLRYNGFAPISGTASIRINASIEAESISIESSGVGEVATDYIQSFADNIKIGLLKLKADVQRNITGGTNFYGSNISIDKVISENVARPIAFQPPISTTNIRENIYVGSIIVNKYIRGLAISYANNWSIGSMNIKERWSGATNLPGYNGVLLQGVNNWTMGELYIADAPEHSFRVGGAANTTNFSVVKLTSVNSGGCALKLAVDPSYLCEDGAIGEVVGINTGEGSGAGNKELTRLTRVKNLDINSISGYVWVTRCVAAQDVEKLTIGYIYGENIQARVFQTVANYDASSGNVDGVYVGNVIAYMSSVARAAYDFSYSDGLRTIGNITIENSFVTGYSNFFITTDQLNIYSGPIFVKARCLSTDPLGIIENASDTILFQLNLTRGHITYKGKAFNSSFTAENTIQTNEFENISSVTPAQKGAIYLKSSVISPSQNKYGASISFSRLDTDRRGAAVVSKQTGTNENNMGLSFLCGATTIGTDAVTERMVIKHSGTVNFPSLPTSSAGLVSGDIWNNGGVVNIIP